MKAGLGGAAEVFDLTPYQLVRLLGASKPKPRKAGAARARLLDLIGDH